MNSPRTSLAIVDMQDWYVPSEWNESYMAKRDELILNIKQLSHTILWENGLVIIVNTLNHWDIIPELQYLENSSQNVVQLTKHYMSLLHFPGTPLYNRIRNLYAMKRVLRWDELQIVWVNASWCVLETARSVKKLSESDPKYWAKITVPFYATMNIPYPESTTDDSALLRVNTARSIRDEYDNHIGNDVLVWKSLFE